MKKNIIAKYLALYVLGVGSYVAPTNIALAQTVQYDSDLQSNFDSKKYADPDYNMDLYLDLYVNGVATNHLAFVEYKKPYYYISGEDLKETPISLDHFTQESDGKIALNANSDVKVSYNAALQQLEIDVPPAWLPTQYFGDKERYVEAHRSFGAIFNYDIYGTRPKGGGSSVSTWSEARIFTDDKGFFSTTGVYNTYFGSQSNYNSDKYIRYDTYWEYSNEKDLYTVKVGDLFTRPLAWTSSARLGGAQFSHNFALRPDLITYPLPEFNGQVGVPSTVELLINGNRSYSANVNPGPYDINAVSHLSGSGNAVIVTTDALGRTVEVDVPFYVTSQLLKKGLFDYSVSTGSLRKDYGQKNFSYSQYALDASVRYGLTDNWTVEGHTEVATSLQVLGAGVVTNVGRIGVINASFMGTRYKENNGHQIYLGYQYTNSKFNFSTSYRKRSEHYRDIASMDIGDNYNDYDQFGNAIFRDSTSETIQATVSRSFNDFGSFSLGYYSTKYQKNGNRDETVSLGWSKSFKEYGSLSTYINRNNDKDHRWAASIQWTISLGNLSSISASVAQNDNVQGKDKNYSFSYDKQMATDGGFGWRMNYNHYNNRDDYYNGALSWRNNKVRAEGGFFGETGNISYWGDLSGSLIFMDGQFMAANEATDSFVLVSTNGVKDVGVKYENNAVGKTDRKGYLLVPNVPSYYQARYDIAADELPLNMYAPEGDKRIAVKSGGGYLLQFPIEKLNPTILTLVDGKGNPIAIGSHVITDTGEDSFVGWDGEIYLEHLQTSNKLTVALAGGGSCSISVDLTEDQLAAENQIKNLGAYSCTQGR